MGSFRLSLLIVLAFCGNAFSQTISFEPTGMAHFRIQSTDYAHIMQLPEPGQEANPRTSEDAPPLLTYRTRYADVTRSEFENRLVQISAALQYGANDSDGWPGNLSSAEAFVHSSGGYASYPLRDAIQQLIGADPRLSSDPYISKIDQIRQAIPDAALLSDDTLAALIKDVEITRLRSDRLERYRIYFSEPGGLSISPGRPNGKDGRFYFLIPVDPDGRTPENYAQLQCQSVTAYWSEVLGGKLATDSDYTYLRALGLPTTFTDLARIIDEDCTELERQIAAYNRYIQIALNLFDQATVRVEHGPAEGDVQREREDAHLHGLIDGIDLGDSGELGDLMKASLFQLGRLRIEFGLIMSPRGEENWPDKPVTNYWQANRSAADYIVKTAYRALIVRPIFSARLFAAKPAEVAAGFDWQGIPGRTISSDDNAYMRALGQADVEFVAVAARTLDTFSPGVGGMNKDASYANALRSFELQLSAFRQSKTQKLVDLVGLYADLVKAVDAEDSRHGAGSSGTSELWSPVPAVVVARLIDPGTIVPPSTPLVDLVALGRWVGLARLPASSLPSSAVPTPATLILPLPELEGDCVEGLTLEDERLTALVREWTDRFSSRHVQVGFRVLGAAGEELLVQLEVSMLENPTVKILEDEVGLASCFGLVVTDVGSALLASIATELDTERHYDIVLDPLIRGIPWDKRTYVVH